MMLLATAGTSWAAGTAGAQVRDTTVRGVMAARPDTIPARAISVRLEIGGVLPHQLYGSPDGEIAASFGGVARAAVEYRLNRGLGTFAMLGGSIVSVEERVAGAAVGSGNATQFDVMAGVTWQPPIRERSPEPVTLHVAGGGAWISGPEELAPFARMADEDQPVPVWEAGLSIRPTRRRFSGVAVLQMTKVLPSAADEDVWAQRLIIALRLGT